MVLGRELFKREGTKNPSIVCIPKFQSAHCRLQWLAEKNQEPFCRGKLGYLEYSDIVATMLVSMLMLDSERSPKTTCFFYWLQSCWKWPWECENSVSALQQSLGLDLNQPKTNPNFFFIAERTWQVAACHPLLRRRPMVNNRGLLRGVVGSFWALRLGSIDGWSFEVTVK